MNARVGSRWRRWVGCTGLPLALFALAIQAVVTFGHHHFNPNDPHFSDATLVAAMVQTAKGAPHRLHHNKNAPAEPDSEPCLVCMAIHAGAAPLADVPQVAIPVEIGGAALPLPVLSSPIAAWRVAAFEPRGPPLA